MRHVTLKIMLLAAFALMVKRVGAASVDADAARSRASSFLQSQRQGRLSAPNVALRLAHAEPSTVSAGQTAYYVFNSEGGDAFVIVAGDDRAVQILAYGDEALDMANLPSNLQWWLGQYKAQIEWLVEQPEVVAPAPVRARADDVVIEPLLKTIWHQSTPFNDMCPVIDGEASATGCVATAMAQVMNYWKYPAQVPPLPGYVTDTEHYNVPSLPSAELEWDYILDVYNPGDYNEEEAVAVATLLRYCGQGCFMDYSPMGSGAWQEDQLMALKQFGYNHEAQCLYRDECEDVQWHAMIMEELSNDRPVLYTGTSFGGAHAFVLDGYKDGKYHVNWGWGGGNGYFVLDALGRDDWEFNYYQTMQYHVYPDPEGNSVQSYDFEVSGIYYKRNGDAAEVVRRDIMHNCYSGSIVIPETVTLDGETLAVTSIAPYAFMDCMEVTDILLPPSVTNIGANAFYRCSAMTTIRIQGKNKRLGKDAFADCYGLSEVYTDDVESWATMEFVSRCSCPLVYGPMLFDKKGNAITDVLIPASVDKVGNYLFTNYDYLKSVLIEEGVTAIGHDSFYGCDEMTSVTLPQSLRSIGDDAFDGCTQLSDLILPPFLESIGVYAFYACESLTHVDIPGSVSVLGDVSFGACTNLAQVTLNSGLTRVGEYAFYYCLSLNDVILPSTVTSIGYAAFDGCSNLSNVTLNDNLQELEDFAFNDCPSLQKIVIPSSVTLIGIGAFIGCSSLATIVLDGCSSHVDSNAFMSCSQLARVEIRDLLSWCNMTFENDQANPLYFAHHLFMNGEEVCDLAIPAGVKHINDYAFIRCESLTSLTMSNDVESVGEQAFKDCKKMTVATLGDGVRTIGEKAFHGCSKLMDFTFGKRMKMAEMYAFRSCNALVKITSRAVTPPYLKGKSIFPDKVYKNAIVYAPRQSLRAYREALVWRYFDIEGVNFMPEWCDVNGDGEVNISDVTAIIDIQHKGGVDIVGDVNGDEEVNISDINAVIDYIITGE